MANSQVFSFWKVGTVAAYILAAWFGFSAPAAAFDATPTGKIAQIDAVPEAGDNYGFRVTLQGSTNLCGTGWAWAYVNKSFDNYQASVATLTSAFLAGKSVTLYLTHDTPSGYCKIGFLSVLL